MSLLDSFRSTEETEQTGYEAAQIDADLAETLTAEGEREAVSVRPDKSNEGIEAMANVLESLHSVETESPLLRRGSTNISPAHTFEMRYTRPPSGGDRAVSLHYIAGDDRTDGALERQLHNQYPDSQISREPARVLSEDVTGRYIAGATLELRRYTLYPIKNIDLPGFTTDPTGSILEEMVGTQVDGESGADVVVQMMFKPAKRTWTDGVKNGHGIADDADENIRGEPGIKTLAKNLREPTYEKHWRVFTRETVPYPPSKVDKKVAKLLEEQQGEKGWRLCLRVLAVSEDPEIAVDRASDTAGMFRNFYENRAEQTFVPSPLSASDVLDVAGRTGRREWRDRGLVKAQREVAGLLNIPKAEYVTTNKMPWALTKPGSGVPVGTPRVDWGDLDATPRNGAEKQVAMLNADSSPGDPIWLGFGAKHGTEAGIFEKYLNAHLQVTGGTRKGKTTALTNINRQLAERDYGGLVIVNGKENDEDRFIEEFPGSRDEEDFVFIDTSDEYDKRIRFNLLEIPTDAEPGSSAFDSAAESLAEDWAASFAEAGGGSDDYWGPLMDRVCSTVIIGLAKRGQKATPLDVAAACSDSDGLDKFSQFMDEERIAFVRRQARRIAEKEDADLEPLAGRMAILQRHAGLRNFLCARNPSASIQDLVAEGKWCVVRIDPNLSESEIKFMLTPLVRRFYTAKKTQPNAPRFYLLWDEFDKAVSKNTNIHELLSIAGGHDFRMILSCQAPSNQLYSELKNAMQNQVDTVISFGTGEEDAKYVSSHHSVDADSLTGMGRYKFWLRTDYQHKGEEDKTDSYLVNAFPPTREVRADVEGESPRDPEKMKRESVERYGDIPKSAEELQNESEFYDDVAIPTDGDGEQESTNDPERAILKAVLDESIHTAGVDVGGVVAASDAEARIRDYLGAGDDGIAKVWDLVDGVPTNLLERTQRDGETHLRTTERGQTRVFESGDDENAGGIGHRELLRDSYVPLSRLGLTVDIVRQDSEGNLADAWVEPEALRGVDTDSLSLSGAAKLLAEFREENPLLAQLTGGEATPTEDEHETSTKPGQTILNLAQAIKDAGRCLFVARPDAARRVDGALTDPPMVNEETADGDRVFYNRRDLRIDGELLFRPAGGPDGAKQTVWRFDGETGEYVLADSNGVEHARFGSHEAIFTDADAYPATESGVDDTDEWKRVKKPVIPERVFGDETPTPEAWNIVVCRDESAETDLALLHDGELTPIGGGESDTTATDDVEDSATDADDGDDDELDVAERPAALFELLRAESDGAVTTTEAYDLAGEHGGDLLDVSRRSIGNYLDALDDAGAVTVDRSGNSNQYHISEE